MEWINVEDRFPEEEQDCWVCQHDDTITKGQFIFSHELFGEGFGSFEEFIKMKYVKCWMPYFTPDPPEDELEELE